MKRIIYILYALLIITLTPITGCGQTEPSETGLSAAEILNNSYENMQAVDSFHYLLDQVGGGTPITSGIEMTRAEGDVIRPDKMQAKITGTAMGMSIQVQLVTADGQMLMTNPLSGKWETIPEQFQVLNIFDPGSGIAAIIKEITTPAKLDDEQAGDALCYHLKGDITSEKLRPLTGSSMTGVIVNAEVWIGQEDFLVRQIKLNGKITEGENEGIVRTLTLTGFNEVLNITLPQ